MAAPVVIQSTGQNGPGSAVASLSKAFTSDVTSGNLIIVTAAHWYALGPDLDATSVTDDDGNTYTRQVPAGGANIMGIWTAIAGSSGPLTVTVTPPAHGEYLGMGIMEASYFGALTFSAATSGAVSPGTAVSTGNMTPPTEALLVGVLNCKGDAGTITEGGSWTLWFEDEAFTNLPWACMYRTVAAGTYAATWTTGNSIGMQAEAVSIEGELPEKFVGIIGDGATVVSDHTIAVNLDGTPRTVDVPKAIALGGRMALFEQAEEPDAVAGAAILYAVDNGSGKTKLMVKFQTGSAIQLEIEA